MVCKMVCKMCKMVCKMLCKMVRTVFIEHRKALENDVNYIQYTGSGSADSVGVDAPQEADCRDMVTLLR